MDAYDSARFHALLEKQQAGEGLTAFEQRTFDNLEAEARREWENQSRPHWYGGDYPDVF